MKQDKIVSNFLRISAKKMAKTASEKAQCEVIGVAPEAATGKEKGSKKAAYSLHRDFKDFRPIVERLVEAGEFSPKAGSCLVRYLETGLADHLLVVGTGADREGVNALGPAERLRRIGANVAAKLAAEKIKTAVVHLDTFLMPANKLAIDAETAGYAFAEGMGLASYKFKKYFSSGEKDDAKKSDDVMEVTLLTNDAGRVNAFNRGIARADALVTGAYIARDLSNEPSNLLTPAMFADRAKKFANEFGLKFSVLDEKQIAKEGMGLLAGVGQGSVNPPRLIVLEYAPRKKAKKTIAFVGKGITFDSGGISIKPSARMEDMKHDMSGAAAVVGGIVAAALVKSSARIICVVAAAENMPSGNAICPGNVLVSRAGKTVEINNTDAEGRLVLADALDYVQDMKPDYVINLATLTGAIGVALGKGGAGLMSNDEDFAEMVKEAARVSGERVVELPLFDEYFDELKSEYADMRNSGDGPSNGAQRGGIFLQQYIRKGQPWVHLDIASMAYSCGHVPYNPRKAGTGYGVRILVELANQLG